MSTATGLVYSRQNAGRFESERHPLIEVSQLFTNNDFPILTSLSTNRAGTNDLIPVISAGRPCSTIGNSAYEWSPGPPLTLDIKQTSWSVNRDPWLTPGRWGQIPDTACACNNLFAPTRAGAGPGAGERNIRKLVADMKKNGDAGIIKMDRVDIDGDGRKIWFCGSTASTGLQDRLYIFLRGVDQKLPERPTQILHCRGLPIPSVPRKSCRHAAI